MWLQVEEKDILSPGGKKKGGIRPHLGVIAFSPGQAKWKGPEQTISGTDFKVGIEAARPHTKGLRELLAVLAIPGALHARQRGPDVPQKLSQVCEEDWGHSGHWINDRT